MRVAVTGAAGQLGRAVIRQLVKRREVEAIIAMDRRPPGTSHPKVHPVTIDVRSSHIREALANCDALMHLAFIVELGSRDADLVESINIGGSKNVIGTALELGVRQIVYASSIASYGFHPENVGRLLTEDDPVRGNPEFYYTRNKAAVEHWLDEIETRYPDARIARMRPTIFLGTRSDRPSAGLFHRRLWFYLSGKAQPTQVTHQDDVAAGFVLALRKKAHGAFNLATTDPLPMSEWGKVIGKRTITVPRRPALWLMGRAFRRGWIEMDPVWQRASQDYPIVVSAEKARKELGWRPQFKDTASVLRAVSGRGAATASPATKMLFGTGGRLQRLLGSSMLTPEQSYEIRTVKGALNFVFTGDQPSEWHLRIDHGSMSFYEGLDPDGDATVSLPDALFHKLLRGEENWPTVEMTGRARFRGSGDWSFYPAAIITQFRKMSSDDAPRAKRLFAGRVLARMERS